MATQKTTPRKSLVNILGGVVLCAVFLGAGTAHAHYLWIEQSESGARLYYGEADVLLREGSPGKLDNIKSPQAFATGPEGKSHAVALQRAHDHFSVSGTKAPQAILISDESGEVRDLAKQGLGIAKTNYYARHGRPGATDGPSPLALDIRGGTNTLTVLYRGQPLKNARLEVIAPNTWVQEHTTNAHGVVEINIPWRGQYVLHILHVDSTPGEISGRRYENLRNHFTYTFVRQDGADPGPALPPKQAAD